MNGKFHWNPQTLSITNCLGDVITQSVLEADPGGLILVAKVDVAPTSPPVHLRYTTLLLLGLNLGGTVEGAGVGRTWVWDDGRKLQFGL